MIDTFILLARRLPIELAKIAHAFITPTVLSPEKMGESGHFELCVLSDYEYAGEVLSGACTAGHFEIIKAILTNCPNVYISRNDIMVLSSWLGSLPLIKQMTTDPELYEECIKIGLDHGDYEFSAHYFLLLGPTDQDRVIGGYSRFGHPELAKRLVDALASRDD